ncbi:hypothetical protein [Nostoc flagelliforme]|nr:hypothetical protein [Nostoc flagelliforme]
MDKPNSFASAFRNALVKHNENARSSSAPDASDNSKSFADRANAPIAPSVAGLVKSFDSTPEMKGLLNSYFGIGDFLAELPGMTPNQVAQMADQLDQLNILLDNLPAIEQNLRSYIEGVVKYHEFVNRCVKEGVSGIKKVDQSVLDIFIAHKGYLGDQKKLAADSSTAVAQIDNEVENYVDLQEHKLQAALKRAAKKLKADKEKETAKAETEPNEKPVEMVAVLDTRARLRRLMQYGTTSPKAFTPMKSAAVERESGVKNGTAANSVFEFLSGK